MEPTISIPQHWKYPRYIPGQRTEQGEIIGMKYYAQDTYLGRHYGEGWRYVMLPDKNQEDEEHQLEDKVKLLTPEQLKTQLQSEIDYYSRQLEHMKSQLSAIPETVTVATGESGEQQETPTQAQKKSWESPPTLQSFINAAQVILKQISQHSDYLALDYQPDLTVGDAQTALCYLTDELETNQQSAATAKSVS
ncbi:MAG TPA: bZIP transcription factor [Leptolyngbyaceae cyanobacterium]